MQQSRTGTPLTDDVLARRTALPRKPAPVILIGAVVELVPLDLERDAAGLHAVSNGEPISLGGRTVGAYDPEALIWRYLAGGPFAEAAELANYHRRLIETPDLLPMCVRDRPTGHPIGVVTFMSNFPEHLKIELGNIWYSPIAQRTNANLESTYLMLRHAFDLGYRRVEWKCDALNLRSRRAATRMGFTFEGIQDAHFIVKGRNRDTAWFRILDRDWPEVQARLEGMLGLNRPSEPSKARMP
jgi:RimJ/RimL family protein N-acetyltransferase